MKQKQYIFLIGLFLLTLVLMLINLSFGSINIPILEVLKNLFGLKTSNETWQYIICNYRLPKAITAVLTGFGLSISGLMMQTLFRNPLAGPYVLGLSSGSSLGVALVIMGVSFFPALFVPTFGIVIASCIGSAVVFLLVLMVSQKMRDTVSILIVGLMFGSFASAIVSLLTYFSSAVALQKFTFWAMGSIGNLSWDAIIILTVSVFIGLLLAFVCIKGLDALLLGEDYAKSLGLNYKRFRFYILLSTSILAGSITAFVGPIAFIGMAVPHIARMVFKTSQHLVLFFGTLLFGAIIMLCCDIMSNIPGTEIKLPINAITSLFGAPVVIWYKSSGVNFPIQLV